MKSGVFVYRSAVRRGWMLMELAVATTAASVLMALAVGVLTLLMRSDRLGRDHLQQGQHLTDLADHLRSDVRKSSRAERIEIDSAEQLHLRTDDGRIVQYRQEDSRIVREELSDGAVKSQMPFELPKGTLLQVNQPCPNAAGQVDVTLLRFANSARAAPAHVVNIQAQLGRDVEKSVDSTTGPNNPAEK